MVPFAGTSSFIRATTPGSEERAGSPRPGQPGKRQWGVADSGLASGPISVLHYRRVDIHQSARRHGVRDEDVRHAVEPALVVVDLDAEADPPKELVVGPDRAGNLIEVVLLSLIDDCLLAIHAMPLRQKYRGLLPQAEED